MGANSKNKAKNISKYKKPFFWIILLLIVLLIIFLTSLMNNSKDDFNDNSIEEPSSTKVEDKFENIIYEDILSGMDLKKIEFENKYDPSKEAKLIPVILIDILKVDENKDGFNVYTNLETHTYSFKDGIFKEEGGSLFPRRYDFNKDLEIENIVDAQDGSHFNKSILDMAKGNKKLAENLMASQGSYKENYDKNMEELKRKAIEMGFEDVSHSLDKIPNFESEVEYIKNDKEAEGVISVIKTKDYNELQEERNTIGPSDQAGTHWVYRECVLYHEKTGVCLYGLLDYMD